jgi:hypothetical protein
MIQVGESRELADLARQAAAELRLVVNFPERCSNGYYWRSDSKRRLLSHVTFCVVIVISIKTIMVMMVIRVVSVIRIRMIK